MRRHPGAIRLAALGVTALVAAGGHGHAQPAEPLATPPAVLAVVGERGLNVLHEEFRRGRSDPPPRVPRPRPVELPLRGSFEARLDAARTGVLGRVPANELLHVAGTKILIYWPRPAGGTRTFDLLGRRTHGTGVASAAVGARSGSDPDAWLLWVPHSDVTAWEWVARQNWIDVVSTSYATYDAGGTVGPGDVPRPADRFCPERTSLQALNRNGRAVVAAAGNTDHTGAVLSPSGLPEVHRVGGVDDQGAAALPSASSPAGTTRPYDTGDLFFNRSADPDGLSDLVPFVGTSGSAPRTAGRLTRLIGTAARMVGDTRTRPRPGALVSRPPGGRALSRGPLADGTLTGQELLRVMRHVAVPAAPGPGSYLAEGYGSTSGATDRLAERVLAGEADEPARPDEDALYAQSQFVRHLLFPPGRC
jgi:hypothetical protein